MAESAQLAEVAGVEEVLGRFIALLAGSQG